MSNSQSDNTGQTGPARVATTAPNGNVGRHVVRDLIRAGLRPRVLAHSTASVDEALIPHVETVVVDLSRRSEVEAALAGVQSLFLTVPAAVSDDPLADYELVGMAVSQAASTVGLQRVVLQSSVGAELGQGAGEIDGLSRVESLLDSAGLSAVHLRCGYFFTNLLMQVQALQTGTVPVVLPTDQAIPWVAPVDIARVASGWLLRQDWSGRHVQAVHGPADLSWDEVAAVVSQTCALPVQPARVEDEQMTDILLGTGMPQAMASSVLAMSTFMRDGFVAEQPRDETTTTPTTLSSWAYEVLRPVLYTT